MVKKVLVSITAAATAFSMLVAPSITAFAEAPDSDSPVAFSDGQSHDVGNVTITDGGTAVTASNEGTVVNVEGSVDASGATESTDSSGHTIYNGATGIQVEGGAEVNVSHDVTGAYEGAWIYSSGTLNVDGDVKATGSDKTVWAWNPETQSYDIPVNSSYGDAISSSWGDANINVKGDVSGVTTGLHIQMDNNDNKPSITIGGTISASGYNGRGIDIFNHAPNEGESTNAGTFVFDDIDDVLDDLPELTVYEIDAPNPVVVYVTTQDGDVSTEVREKVVNSINYIIKQDASSSEYVIVVSGDNVKTTSEGYMTVNINKAFNVAADLPDGYTISGGDNVTVTKNSDGMSYTLVLTNERGGIYISAKLIPVTTPSGSTAYVVEATDNTENNTPTETTPASAANIPTEAVTVVSSSAEAPAQALPIEGAVAPARSVSVNMTKLTPAQYKEVVVQNVAATPAGTTLRLETDRVSVFDRTMIEAIASNPTIDVEVLFTYNGQKFRVVIPAGYDVRTLLDSNGYCGFLRLAALLGSQTVG
ncbi:MAG: hypothetical protein J6M92_16755 [Oribacterium sp.]|nr:hypothetical protein [Oribacterium sp.]